MREREMQRCGLDGNLVTIRQRFDPSDLRQNFRRRLLVLKAIATDEDAGAVGSPNDDVDFELCGFWHKALKCACSWSSKEYLPASSNAVGRDSFRPKASSHGSTRLTPNPHALIVPFSQSLERARKAPVRAVSNMESHASPWKSCAMSWTQTKSRRSTPRRWRLSSIDFIAPSSV